MNRNQAEAWKKAITKMLTGKDLVTVGITKIGIRCLVKQKFDRAYIVEYNDGSCAVAICDTYGVMTGASKWALNTRQRSIKCSINDPECTYLWKIYDDYESHAEYLETIELQRGVWEAI